MTLLIIFRDYRHTRNHGSFDVYNSLVKLNNRENAFAQI